MLEERDDLLRRGMNVASAALALMAQQLPAERARQIPRAAALLTATRDLPVEQTPAGDWRFTAPGTGGKPPASRSPRSRSLPEPRQRLPCPDFIVTLPRFLPASTPSPRRDA